MLLQHCDYRTSSLACQAKINLRFPGRIAKGPFFLDFNLLRAYMKLAWFLCCANINLIEWRPLWKEIRLLKFWIPLCLCFLPTRPSPLYSTSISPTRYLRFSIRAAELFCSSLSPATSPSTSTGSRQITSQNRHIWITGRNVCVQYQKWETSWFCWVSQSF